MKEKFRLILSFTLALLVHMGFIFYVTQSAATVKSNNSFEAVRFNILALAKSKEVEQEKSSGQPSKDVNLASRKTIVQTPVRTVIKKVFVEKEIHINKELLQPKKQPVTKNDDKQTKIASSVVEVPIETKRSQSQEKLVKNNSVTRQVDDTIVQKARFKSLPPPPIYPRRARLRGQEGTALIHAKLNITGEVIKTRLVRSSGFSLLDKAAIKAVYHWDFMPGATEIGRVQVWVEIPVQFILQPLKLS